MISKLQETYAEIHIHSVFNMGRRAQTSLRNSVEGKSREKLGSEQSCGIGNK